MIPAVLVTHGSLGIEGAVAFVRQGLHRQLERRGAGANELAQATEVLDPEVLWWLRESDRG